MGLCGAPFCTWRCILFPKFPQNSRRSVLIVDRSTESREVLRTALALRGVEIHEARAAQEGLDLARRVHPGVIVVDLEQSPMESEIIQEGYQDQSERDDTSIVLLASARRDVSDLPDGQFVSKPYHYGPLIRKIEELLEPARPAKKAA